MRLSVLLAAIGLLTRAAPAFSQTPVQESEPNDTPATADTASLGDQVKGAVGDRTTSDPADYWTIHANAGDTIYAAIDYCPGCNESAFSIHLFRSDGTEPTTVISSGMGADPQLTYVAEASGWYFVRVGFSGIGITRAAYTLTFRNRTCPDDPNEPNDSLTTAPSIGLNSDITGRWCPNGDRELFRIDAHAGDVLEFWIDSVHANFYSGVDLTLRDANGTSLNPEVQPNPYDRTERGVRNRYEVTADGALYIEPSTYFGTPHYDFQLHVRSPVRLPRGPGDPTTVKAESTGVSTALATDEHGNLWITGEYEPLVRLSPDGTITGLRFPASDAFPYSPSLLSIAWDGYGNAFILTSFAILRFVPPDRVEPLMVEPPRNDQRFGAMAVRSDGLWLARYTLRNGSEITSSSLQHYDFTGTLLASQQLYGESPYTISNLTVGPDSALYYAFGDGIYRVGDGAPSRVLQHPGVVSAFAFDSRNDIYVADSGAAYQGGFFSRVALYGSSGGVIADPFSWWPIHPRALAFGRNADGSASDRLFVLDRLGSKAKLLELNPAGVQAPGLTPPIATCPVEADEVEPNDAPQQAREVRLDTEVRGVSCRAGDQDYFRVVSTRSGSLTIALTGSDHPMLELLDATGAARLSFDEAAGAAHITHEIEAGKTYYVRVANWVAGPHAYTLQIGSPTSRPDGLTVERAARELARPHRVLSDAERSYLDGLGNGDGRYDVGDFRAFLNREAAPSGKRP
jgi:hypothetical protein